MKKLMITAAALCATVGLYAEVQSANIVGYNTITIDKKYNLIGVNFQSVSGGALSIQDAIVPSDNMTKGNAVTAADQIQIMDASGTYVTYYLSNGYAGKGSYPETAGKWVKFGAATTPATDTIPTGTGFWFITKDAPAEPFTIQVAGSVLMSSSEDKTLTTQYSIVANPYPMDIPLNDGVVAENGTKGNAVTAADQIQIMDSTGAYTTYYLSNGYAGKGSYPATADKWVKFGSATTATTDKVPAGAGVWFIRKSDSTSKLTFTNPAMAE